MAATRPPRGPAPAASVAWVTSCMPAEAGQVAETIQVCTDSCNLGRCLSSGCARRRGRPDELHRMPVLRLRAEQRRHGPGAVDELPGDEPGDGRHCRLRRAPGSKRGRGNDLDLHRLGDRRRHRHGSIRDYPPSGDGPWRQPRRGHPRPQRATGERRRDSQRRLGSLAHLQLGRNHALAVSIARLAICGHDLSAVRVGRGRGSGRRHEAGRGGWPSWRRSPERSCTFARRRRSIRRGSSSIPSSSATETFSRSTAPTSTPTSRAPRWTPNLPVAVFSGNVTTSYGREAAGVHSPDMAHEELPPLGAWSRGYVAASLQPQAGVCETLLGTAGGSLWRILAGTDKTQIVFDPPDRPGLPTSPLSLDRGGVAEFVAAGSFSLMASSPVLVTQGMDCEPSLSLGVSTDRLLKDWVFAVLPGFDQMVTVARTVGRLRAARRCSAQWRHVLAGGEPFRGGTNYPSRVPGVGVRLYPPPLERHAYLRGHGARHGRPVELRAHRAHLSRLHRPPVRSRLRAVAFRSPHRAPRVSPGGRLGRRAGDRW